MEKKEARGEKREQRQGTRNPKPETRNPKPSNRAAELETHLLFAVVAIIAWWIFREDWIILVGLGLGVIGLFIRPLAYWVDWAWRKFSEGLGWVMSKVVMGIVYIFALIPIATLARISRNDPLMLKPKETYWHVRDKKMEKEDLEKMW